MFCLEQSGRHWELRREVIRTLGIVGAPDSRPVSYIRRQDEERAVRSRVVIFAERGSETVTELQGSNDSAPAVSKVDEDVDALNEQI
jgi:hypothetical protein